ncbi:MAG: PAS domain S-box protein [Sulfuricella sp.]
METLAREITNAGEAHACVSGWQRENPSAAAFENVAIGIAVCKPDGEILQTNHQFCEILGLSEEGLRGELFQTRSAADATEKWLMVHQELLTGERDSYSFDERLRRKSGQFTWTNVTASLARNDVGEPEFAVFALEDISERKAMESAIERLGRHYELMLHVIDEGILVVDTEMRLTFANQASVKMLGWANEELLGRYWHEVNCPLTGTKGLMEKEGPINRALREGVPGQENDAFFRRQDGERIRVEYTCSPLCDNADIHGAVVVFRDITQRKQYIEALQNGRNHLKNVLVNVQKTQVQLSQSAKMTAVGRLASGLAHEINNPISFVSSNLFSLEDYVRSLIAVVEAYERVESTDASTRDAYQDIHSMKKQMDLDYLKHDLPQMLAESKTGVARVTNIVHELRFFSQLGEENEWQIVDVHKELDSTLDAMLDEMRQKKAKFTKTYAPLPSVQCLPGQLDRVFLNLLLNAFQAIPDAGEISIRTGKDRGFIWVEITDTGVGIRPEDLPRIFEPFFSTKQERLGLGLSICYAIMQRHQGRIEVNSKFGVGTSFRITLPQSQEMSIRPLSGHEKS